MHTYPRTCKRLDNNHSRAQKISNALTSSTHRAMHRHTQVVTGAERFFPTDAQERAALRAGPRDRAESSPAHDGMGKVCPGRAPAGLQLRKAGRPRASWLQSRLDVAGSGEGKCLRSPPSPHLRHPPAGTESAVGEGGYAVPARVGGGGREGTANTPSLQARQPYELQHELTFIECLLCARLCAQRFSRW